MSSQQPNKNNSKDVQLTKNFKLSEFVSGHDPNILPAVFFPNIQKLAHNLQMLRDHIGKPIVINSGYRSPSHNIEVGGAPHSQHLTGKAADIHIPGLGPKMIADIIEDLILGGFMREGGLGIYDTWVHYDIRGTAARWDLRSKK